MFFFFKQKTAYEIGVRLVGSEMCIRDRNKILQIHNFCILSAIITYALHTSMVDFLKELVSGKKKNRTKEMGFNLDLTYVCPRIVAMSYPASGLEATYRNNINEVAAYLQERHGDNYRVYNLSGRKYEENKFHFNVMSYEWEDHHSPPLDTLFEICKNMDEYLQGSSHFF
eukprot:TRINITY_DN8932_c0_g1_i3.p4 TRINITY_DN8932_c0_g1~~TRINITY_DN8932_c0_g1_i3.p4  ORF type:complete len:170 (-),score=36.74 TRINITY_DN8932_c0_g1_i3:1083-1592(-)